MTLRVRIERAPPVSSIDGVRLDYFVVGSEYSVGNAIGALLLAEGWAVPLPLDAPKPVEPFDEGDPFDSSTLYRSLRRPPNLIREATVPFGTPDTAADSTRRKRRDTRRSQHERRVSKTHRRRRHRK
jgi:hypothetical protein